MSRKQARGEYIQTDTGNKVSRRCQLIGTTNIILGGKTVIQAEAIIRGDLIRTLPNSTSTSSSSTSTVSSSGQTVAVIVGKYCFIGKGSCLRPPGKLYRGQFSHYPLKMGDHVYIGPSVVVEAALIGSHVHIETGCIIGKFAIIKDYVRVLENTIIPANMVIPSFSIIAGRPARIIGEIPEGGQEDLDCRELYRSI